MGRKQSLADTVPSAKLSTCCSTGSGRREANTSPGSSSTGRRSTCATAAAVIMLVAPGPIDVVQAIMRRQCLADAGDIAVAEDCPHAAEQRYRVSVAFGALRRQIAHQRLRHGQSD